MNGFERFKPKKSKADEAETCVYNHRSFNVKNKTKLKYLGLTYAMNLEAMVNWAVELGIREIEAGRF